MSIHHLLAIVLFAPALALAAPGEGELERWLESDDPLPPSVSTAHVNEGELRVLASPPPRPVHHHHQRLTLVSASLGDGWVRMAQCHENLDRVPATQIVFRKGRVRELRVTRAERVGRAWVEGESVQLENVERGARVCLEGWTRALTALPDGRYRIVSGPYMRRFLDGYYPMRVTFVLEHPGLRVESVSPPRQPGLEVRRESGRLSMDVWFEGRLELDIVLRRPSP